MCTLFFVRPSNVSNRLWHETNLCIKWPSSVLKPRVNCTFLNVIITSVCALEINWGEMSWESNSGEMIKKIVIEKSSLWTQVLFCESTFKLLEIDENTNYPPSTWNKKRTVFFLNKVNSKRHGPYYDVRSIKSNLFYSQSFINCCCCSVHIRMIDISTV